MCFNLNLLNQCLPGISKENQEANSSDPAAVDHVKLSGSLKQKKNRDHQSIASESLLDQHQQQHQQKRRSTSSSFKNTFKSLTSNSTATVTTSLINSNQNSQSKQQQQQQQQAVAKSLALELINQSEIAQEEFKTKLVNDAHHRRIGDKLSNYNRAPSSSTDRRRSSANSRDQQHQALVSSLFVNPITSSLSSFSSLEPSVLSSSSVESDTKIMENNNNKPVPPNQLSRQTFQQQSPQMHLPSSPQAGAGVNSSQFTIPFQLSAQSQPLPPPNSLPPFHHQAGVNQFPMNLNQQQLSPRALMSLNNTNSGLTSLNRPFINLEKSSNPFELNMKNLNMKKHAYTFDADQLLPTKPTPNDQELSSLLDENLNNMRLDDSMFNHPSGSLTSSNASLNSTGKYIYEKKAPSSNPAKQQQHHHHKPRGGKIHISAMQVYEFVESDFQNLGQIGHGEFGTVDKVLHKPSQTYMAMKRLLPTVGNQRERKKALKELDFVLECHEYEFVVKFYGVKFNNEPADCLICMELMDTSLEKFYKFVYDVKNEEIPEPILGRIVYATVNALNYLKEKHQIIHRDVKPSNILVDRHGAIKMCDFGISGRLVDSIAASRDAGCQLYMAVSHFLILSLSDLKYVSFVISLNESILLKHAARATTYARMYGVWASACMSSPRASSRIHNGRAYFIS